MAGNKRFLLLGLKLRNKIREICTTHRKSSYFIGKILINIRKIEVLLKKNVTGGTYTV
jgi:hypothetical protein